MSKKLVEPLFYVYKLTFSSGRSYIGSHVQRFEEDGYITSSSYFQKHPEDKILNREILICLKDKFTMSLLETICIMSDKANNIKNVNYNFGEYVHRLDWSYRTEAELKQIKDKISKSLKKYYETADLTEVNKRISATLKKYYDSLTDDELKQKNKKRGDAVREAYKNKSDEWKRNYSQMRKNTIKEDKQLYDKLKKQCIENNKKTSKKCLCVETGQIFNSYSEAARWATPTGQGNKVSLAIRTGRSAYKHPVSKIPLHWKSV